MSGTSSTTGVKKRKTFVPVIDTTLHDDDDDKHYNRPFSPLSEHDESDELLHSKKHSRKEEIEPLDSPSQEKDASNSTEDIDEDDEDNDEDDNSGDGVGEEKKKMATKSGSIKQSARLTPDEVAISQYRYVDHSSSDGTFQVMYTPLNVECRDKVEYSIGFITVAVKEVSEDQFLSHLFAAHGEVKNSAQLFFEEDSQHCCEGARSITHIGKPFVDAGIPRDRIVELARSARGLAMPTAEAGNIQLLFVAIRMPLYLMNAIQSPILSYNLRVRILGEKVAGGSAFLAGATRCAALGCSFSQLTMAPLVLTNDEFHRFTMRVEPPATLRCTENLPVFQNAAFVLEALRMSPIAVNLSSPNAELFRLTTQWREIDPQTLDGLVVPQSKPAAELTEDERMSMLLVGASRSRERFVSVSTQDYLVAPQSARNLVARCPRNARQSSWVQTPINQFDRGERKLFARAPLIVTGPCVPLAQVRRAMATFKTNMELRHTQKINALVSRRVVLTEKCCESIMTRSNVSVWLDAVIKAKSNNIQSLLTHWTTPSVGQNEDEVRFNSLYQIVCKRENYLDANGWPTSELVRHFAFAAAACMTAEFWLIASVLSFDTAMVCVLRGVVKTVCGVLTSNCPHNLLTLPLLTVSGPSASDNKKSCSNFIRDRAVAHEIDSLALFSYSICVRKEAPWARDLLAKLAHDPTSPVALRRQILEVLRSIATMLFEESEKYADYHSCVVANHFLHETHFDVASLTSVRVRLADVSRDVAGSAYSNALFHTVESSALCDAFVALLSPTEGPFMKRGVEVVRCETRAEHDRTLVIAAARCIANGQDLVVWCDDDTHVRLACNALLSRFESAILFGLRLHEFLKDCYPVETTSPRIMLVTRADWPVVSVTRRCELRERARVCLAFAHRYSQEDVVMVLNRLTSSEFCEVDRLRKAGSSSNNREWSRDEAKVLFAAHCGSEYEANIPGVRQLLRDWRAAAMCGDELIVVGLPLTPWVPCEPVRRGASIVDDLFFAASSGVIAFDRYCDDEGLTLREPAPFLRCVSCAGGFLRILNDRTENHDFFMGGQQTATIGKTKIRFLMRDAEIFGISMLPPELESVAVYLPCSDRVQTIDTMIADIEHEAKVAKRTMNVMSPDSKMSFSDWMESGFLVVDFVPSSTFVPSAPMFSNIRAAAPLVALAHVRRKFNESIVDPTVVNEIIDRGKAARSLTSDLGSLFDFDGREFASQHFTSFPLGKRIKAHKFMISNARTLKRGISIEAIMALFFYEPAAVVWHGDMTEAIEQRFNARLAGFSFNKTPFESSLKDDYPNWYNSYMLCANSPLPYVLGNLFKGHMTR